MNNNQKRFCDEYLIDLNATRAYREAYPSVNSDEVAAANGSRLLTNAKVMLYLSEKMKEREIRTEITQDKVLKELANIGFANVTDYANVVEKEYLDKVEDDEGNTIKEILKKYKTVELENTNELDKDKQSAISEIKRGKNGIEVKLNDKVKALELIGRHLGMFTDKVELNGNVGVNIIDDLPIDDLDD